MALHPRRASPEERKALLLMERTGYIPLELTPYFAWRISEERREEYDRRAIRVDSPLADLLKKLPAPWLGAIARNLGVKKQGKKRDWIPRIVSRLKDPERLREIVRGLPVDARLALAGVLERGGWGPLSDLEREFGAMAGDGWFWEDEPPRSILGQLRAHGLLFIGQAQVGRRRRQVAVIPKDLREPLAQWLRDPEALPPEARSRTATTRALERLAAFYATLERPLLPLEDLNDFLRQVHPRQVLEVEEDVEDFLLGMEDLEMKSADDVAGHHLSLWMRRLRYLYVGEVPLARKRRMLRTTARLYQFLAERGRVMPITAERISEAVAEITAPTRDLGKIPLPPPLGGELLMRLQDPEGNEYDLVMNDYWLVAACAVLFTGDWDAMEEETARARDGARKRERIRWLRRLPEWVWMELLTMFDPEEIDFIREWFYEHEMSELSAW
jgi:hypothetical protein